MKEKDFHKQSTIPGLPEGSTSSDTQSFVEQNVPKQVGPYPIEALLKKGGMSVLYLGTNPNTHKHLTIKVLSADFLKYPEMIDRFFKEAEIIALADHPNIVKLYGHGKWEKGLYIAMEYIKGTSLKNVILHQSLKEKQALEIIMQIASALCHLHTHSIIHRDLKPENILITPEHSIKVIDFGIAQMLNFKSSERITQENHLMGTPIYMSPEQKDSPSKASFPTDIYSLGIIAYELLTNKLCHGLIQLEHIHQNLRPILEKALQADQNRRYQDIVDMILDISKYLKNPTAPTYKIKKEDNKIADHNVVESDPQIEQMEPEKSKKGSNSKQEEIIQQYNLLKEQLNTAQQTLLPSSPPSWPSMNIGVINHRGSNVSGVYYDFFDLKENSYGIIMGESVAPGAPGAIYSSVLRGMIRALSWSASKPVELVSYLNNLLTDDPFDQIFTLSYLILYPNENRLHFISCGYGTLWSIASGSDHPHKITADNIALGIDPETEFLEVTHKWNIGDTLILNTFRAISSSEKKGDNGFSEKKFEHCLKKNALLAPQKLLDSVFKKISSSLKSTLDERPITLISLNRLQ